MIRPGDMENTCNCCGADFCLDELERVGLVMYCRYCLNNDLVPGVNNNWGLTPISTISKDVEDLAGRVAEEVERVNYLRNMVEDRNLKVSELMVDIEAQADIIKDLTSPALLPDDISETGADIVMKCDMLKKMLLEKNKSYGDSALDPVRVFSRAEPEEQLLVRIDDKLSRLSRGKEFAGDDTVMNLIGYLVLLLVSRERAAAGMKEAA